MRAGGRAGQFQRGVPDPHPARRERRGPQIRLHDPPTRRHRPPVATFAVFVGNPSLLLEPSGALDSQPGRLQRGVLRRQQRPERLGVRRRAAGGSAARAKIADQQNRAAAIAGPVRRAIFDPSNGGVDGVVPNGTAAICLSLSLSATLHRPASIRTAGFVHRSGRRVPRAASPKISPATPAGSRHIGTWPQPGGSTHRVCGGRRSRRRYFGPSSRSLPPKATVTGQAIVSPPSRDRTASSVSPKAVAAAKSVSSRTASAADIRPHPGPTADQQRRLPHRRHADQGRRPRQPGAGPRRPQERRRRRRPPRLPQPRGGDGDDPRRRPALRRLQGHQPAQRVPRQLHRPLDSQRPQRLDQPARQRRGGGGHAARQRRRRSEPRQIERQHPPPSGQQRHDRRPREPRHPDPVQQRQRRPGADGVVPPGGHGGPHAAAARAAGAGSAGGVPAVTGRSGAARRRSMSWRSSTIISTCNPADRT